MSRVMTSFLAGRIVTLAIPGLSLICSVAAANPGPNQLGQSTPAMAWRGSFGGDQLPGSDVVMDAGHWNGLWQKLNRDAPPLDFTKYFAVVAYAGEQATGGYSIKVMEPLAQGDDLLIRWLIQAPPPGSFQIQVLTQPWEVQAFQRPKGTVRMEQLKE